MSDYLEVVDEAIKAIRNSDIINNEWAYGYIERRTVKNNDRLRLAEDLEIVSEYLDQKSVVCDHAAAPFILCWAMSILEYEVTATDLAPERFGKNIFPFKCLKYNVESERPELEQGVYDGVIFSHIFEHCRINLITTIDNIYKSLKPKGYLFLSTPNLKSFQGIINFLHKDISYSCAGNLYHEWSKLERIGHMGHVREYTAKEVTTLLENCGFKSIALKFRGSYPQRGRINKLANLAINLNKTLSPNFTIIAQKPK